VDFCRDAQHIPINSTDMWNAQFQPLNWTANTGGIDDLNNCSSLQYTATGFFRIENVDEQDALGRMLTHYLVLTSVAVYIEATGMDGVSITLMNDCAYPYNTHFSEVTDYACSPANTPISVSIPAGGFVMAMLSFTDQVPDENLTVTVYGKYPLELSCYPHSPTPQPLP
jgi:hypothetical protein